MEKIVQMELNKGQDFTQSTIQFEMKRLCHVSNDQQQQIESIYQAISLFFAVQHVQQQHFVHHHHHHQHNNKNNKNNNSKNHIMSQSDEKSEKSEYLIKSQFDEWMMALQLTRSLINNKFISKDTIADQLKPILKSLTSSITHSRVNKEQREPIFTSLHNRPELIVSWGEEYLKSGDFNAYVMGDFLFHLLVSRKYDECEYLFQKIVNPNSFCYDMMIQAECKKQVYYTRKNAPDPIVFDMEKVNDYVRKRLLTHTHGSVIPYVVVVRSLSHYYGVEENIQSFIEFLQLIPDQFKYHDDVVSAVLLIAGRWKDPRIEEITIKYISHVRIQNDNALLMLSRVAKTNERVYVDLFLKRLNESGFDINVKSLNALLKQLLPKNNIETSIELFNYLRTSFGIQQDLETVELFANYFINNTIRNLKDVVLRDDHRDALLQTERNILTLGQFSSYILNQLLKSLLQFSLLEEAFDMIKKHHAVVNDQTVYLMLSYYLSQNDLARAEQTVTFFKDFMVLPGDWYKIRLVTTYLHNNMNHEISLLMIRDIVNSESVPVLEKLSLLDRSRALYDRLDRSAEAIQCRDWKYALTQQHKDFLKKRNKQSKSLTRKAPTPISKQPHLTL